LDKVGVESTVLYPTAGMASSNIVNPDDNEELSEADKEAILYENAVEFYALK
jgi:predicted TIM-barrel fold metal-dependent hydrolase